MTTVEDIKLTIWRARRMLWSKRPIEEIVVTRAAYDRLKREVPYAAPDLEYTSICGVPLTVRETEDAAEVTAQALKAEGKVVMLVTA